MKLYSTLDRKIIDIVPTRENRFTIYSCGPTVYYHMQVGNIRAYVNWDILHRALLYMDYNVDRVMNMTDVGHMSADDDFGEDKVETQASKEGKDPLDISNYYIKSVLKDFSKLNILSPHGNEIDPEMDLEDLEKEGWTRATDYIDRMIEIIKMMEDNDYTYETPHALYFDISKIDDYNIFTKQSLDEKQEGVREDVDVDKDKKNPADFVLWMKRVGKYENHIMHWESPWGDGFPGWHIECSAMSTAILGEHFDIHTGGIDHISIHHPNERAQNIGAFGRPVVRYWVHNEFVVGDKDSKLSKSSHAINLKDVEEMGYEPMDLRYLFASVNYRVQLKFSENSLKGARNARLSLISKLKELDKKKGSGGKLLEDYKEKFIKELRNNLNVSGALAVISDLIKSDHTPEDKLATVYDFDKVFGLNLEGFVANSESKKIPEEVLALVEQRQKAREEKDYKKADELREEIGKKGYSMIDKDNGFTIEKV